MSDATRTRLLVAGTGAMGHPMLARIDLDGGEPFVLARRYVDPVIRSGRGVNPGMITGLAGVLDRVGGQWLLATVERGRPRLIDPEQLGVVALLGRRREWRGAAELRSPFVPVLCDRPPQQGFVLSRSPGGGVDLLRVRPGDAIERWWLGQLAGRVELLASADSLALVSDRRVAILEIGELVPGGCPLTDPRDVELSLHWQPLPRAVVAVCDLLPSALRVIERDGDRWLIAELELGDELRERGRWTVARPHRWWSAGGSLWLASAEGWTRVDPRSGPSQRFASEGLERASATLELADGHPWLWIWWADESKLERMDALALESRESWPLRLAEPLRPTALSVIERSQPGAATTLIHDDELAELLALEPELAIQWPRWFDR